MSAPWMPLYVADYLADTRRLTTLEHGAYMLLIMDYWRNGNLPDDDERLARIAGLPLCEWICVRNAIEPLFLPGWRHKRIDEELEKSAEKSKKAKDSAKNRWKHANADANALPTHSEGNANAMLSQPQSHSSSLRSEELPQPRADNTQLEKPIPDLDVVQSACWAAIGDDAVGAMQTGAFVIGPMMAVVAEIGLSRVVSILQSEAKRPRRKPIRTWKVWADVVRENAADYSSHAPALVIHRNITDDIWRTRLKTWVESGYRSAGWFPNWGPLPGRGGCEVPAHVLSEFPPADERAA